MQRKNSGYARPEGIGPTIGHATKKGPGRRHRGGKPGNRLAKERPLRAYKALMDAWAQKRIINWQGKRDERGAACTMVGQNPRRVWVPA